MTEQDEPALSSALLEARPRPAAAVLRLYTAYYEQLLRYNLSNREFIEQRDAPEQVFRWLVELDCGYVTDALTAGQGTAGCCGGHEAGQGRPHVWSGDPPNRRAPRQSGKLGGASPAGQ